MTTNERFLYPKFLTAFVIRRLQYIYIIELVVIESVDSISRDKRDSPYRRNTLQTLEYLALGTLSRILNTTIVFYG